MVSPVAGLTVTSTESPDTGFSGYDATHRDNDIVIEYVDVVFPSTAGDYLIDESGGTGDGQAAWTESDGTLHVRVGDGGTLSGNTGCAHVSGDASSYTGGTHTVTWEVDVSTSTLRVWVDEALFGTATASAGFPNARWTGGGDVYYGGSGLTLATDVPSTAWPSAGSGGLGNKRVYQGQLSTWTAGTTLSPPLLTNSQTFYGPTVTLGAITLSPSLLTNSQTFYSATVSVDGGPQTLQPPLVANGNTFFGPTVSPGAITLSPALVTNSQTFYSATVSVAATQTLQPPLVSNVQVFYATTVSNDGWIFTKTDKPDGWAFTGTVNPGAWSFAGGQTA